MTGLNNINDLFKHFSERVTREGVLKPREQVQHALLLLYESRYLQFVDFAALVNILVLMTLLIETFLELLFLGQQCLDLELEFFF